MIPGGLVLKSSNFSKYSLSHSITSIKTQSEHDGTATSVAMKGHRVSFELSRKKPAVIYIPPHRSRFSPASSFLRADDKEVELDFRPDLSQPEQRAE